MLTQLPTKLLYDLAKTGHYWVFYYLHYKKKLEIIKSKCNPFFFWPTCKRILLLGVLSHYIVKVINPLYDMLEANTT